MVAKKHASVLFQAIKRTQPAQFFPTSRICSCVGVCMHDRASSILRRLAHKYHHPQLIRTVTLPNVARSSMRCCQRVHRRRAPERRQLWRGTTRAAGPCSPASSSRPSARSKPPSGRWRLARCVLLLLSHFRLSLLAGVVVGALTMVRVAAHWV